MLKRVGFDVVVFSARKIKFLFFLHKTVIAFHLAQPVFLGQEDNHYASHVNFLDILNSIQ